MPNWKKVIISGSDAALNSLEITSHLTASGLMYPTSDGTDGQALTTDGAGNLTFGNPGFAESAQDLIVTGKNMESVDIPKGTPLYFSGSGTLGNVVGVYFADAGNPDRMPTGGVASELITPGSEGGVYLYGFINGVNTSAFNAGDDVFVAVGGGYTNVKPTGSALIQKLGNVEKVHPSNGSGVIAGPSWYNDLPNWEEGKIKVGRSDGQPVTSSFVHLDEPNGRLGLGTASPGAKLDVSGDGIVTGFLRVGPNINNVNTFDYSLQTRQLLVAGFSGTGESNIYIHRDDQTISTGNVIGNLNFSGQDGASNIGAQISAVAVGSWGTTSAASDIVFSNCAPASATLEQRMVIDSDGNVGIGTTSPSASLQVKGSGTTSATTALLVEDSVGTDLLEVNDLGNISIPAGSLSINGASNVEELNVLGNMFFDGSATIAAGGVGDSLNLSAAGANISVGSANSNIVMTGGVSGSFSGSFEGDGTNLTGITAEWDGTLDGDAEITGSLTVSGSSANLTVTGNVGIGTTSPSYALDIERATGEVAIQLQARDDSSNTAIYFGDNSDADIGSLIYNQGSNYMSFTTFAGERMRIQSNGNVGIGTNSPSQKLDVDGNAAISGSLELYNGALLVSSSIDSTSIIDGEIEFGFEAEPVRLNRNKAVLVNSGPDVVATVDSSTFLSAHFDYVIVKGTNRRAGTVMACHDSFGNVVFTETATSDLGSTAGVTLDVVQSGFDLELRMTVPSTGWFIKTFVRAI